MVTRAESLEAEQASLLTKLFQKNLPHCRPYLWNIPAYAGKTRTLMSMVFTPAEHPRVCGENTVDFLHSVLASGTSPCMRGKLFILVRCMTAPWNIPVYAGKTSPLPCAYLTSAEHPRVCGENSLILTSPVRLSGTSPRMRGKLRDSFFSLSGRRNIPAYAGKTASSACSRAMISEHPRVRGENILIGYQSRAIFGTSPRARGKQRGKRFHNPKQGNIPACAGKTPAS